MRDGYRDLPQADASSGPGWPDMSQLLPRSSVREGRTRECSSSQSLTISEADTTRQVYRWHFNLPTSDGLGAPRSQCSCPADQSNVYS